MYLNLVVLFYLNVSVQTKQSARFSIKNYAIHSKKISNSFEIVPIRFLNETSFAGHPNDLSSGAKSVIQTDVRKGFCSHTWPDSVSHDQSSSNMYLLL